MTTTAASLIDQINTKHSQVIEAEHKAIAPAIECGKLLRLAKQTMKAEKGNWKEWCETNIKVVQETISLYMRLADPENEKQVKNAKSIRAADSAIRLKNSNQSRGASSEPSAKEPAIEPEPKTGADVEGVVRATSAEPDEVLIALCEAWKGDDLNKKLGTLLVQIVDHLGPEISNALLKSAGVNVGTTTFKPRDLSGVNRPTA